MKLSQRIEQLPAYHFAAYARTIAAKRAAGVDVINLSMGDPDLPTPPEVIEALTTAAQDPHNQRYPEYSGMPALRSAIADWFVHRFGVELDPAREVVPLLGSKEGLGHLPFVVIDPGDIALLPDPQYPVAPTAIGLAGGAGYRLPLDATSGWLPDLDAVPAAVAERAHTLWLNYPNNPTGACATPEFFERAVQFARTYDILLVHDMAYAEVHYDGYRPHSILEIPGAKDVAVELHSLSKSYNMAGFRIGMLLGNAHVLDGMARLKSNLDSGIFRPIQLAAIRALALPNQWLDDRNAIYQRRRDTMLEAFRALGVEVATTQAGLYLWPRVPAGYTSARFALELLEHSGVAVTPGTNFGAGGEGYVRIALTVADAQIAEAVRRLRQALPALM